MSESILFFKETPKINKKNYKPEYFCQFYGQLKALILISTDLGVGLDSVQANNSYERFYILQNKIGQRNYSNLLL